MLIIKLFLTISIAVITCPVWNYTWPLMNSAEECEANSEVNWSTECVFECDDGYLLEGNDTVICGLDGILNSSIECIRKLVKTEFSSNPQ